MSQKVGPTLANITDMFHKYRNELFCKNSAFDSFAKFTRKHLCWSLLLKT